MIDAGHPRRMGTLESMKITIWRRNDSRHQFLPGLDQYRQLENLLHCLSSCSKLLNGIEPGLTLNGSAKHLTFKANRQVPPTFSHAKQSVQSISIR